jgi:hypothetical protein
MTEREKSQSGETAQNPPKRSRLLNFYRRPNGEKCVVIKRKLHGETIIEEYTEKELLELFRNA